MIGERVLREKNEGEKEKLLNEKSVKSGLLLFLTVKKFQIFEKKEYIRNKG